MSSKKTIDKLLIGTSIITFLLSWIPSIEIKYKLGLLILSITILIIIYLSPYFQISNKLEVRIINLENKIENIEDLIKIKHDIKILKNKVNTK